MVVKGNEQRVTLVGQGNGKKWSNPVNRIGSIMPGAKKKAHGRTLNFSDHSSSATNDSSWTSEKHVRSDDNSDGFEIAMDRHGNGMELMHVMGTKQEDYDMPLTLQSEPTIQVSYLQMEIGYHPACDYETQNRIQTSAKKNAEDLTKEQKLILLGNYETSDEESALRDEMQRNLIEMRNLENERDNITRKLNSDHRLISHKCCIPECEECSNVDTMLDQVKSTVDNLEWEFKLYLQSKRGFCFHASFSNPACRDTFVRFCGGNRNNTNVHPTLQGGEELFTIEKVAASAAAVRHVTITKGRKGTSFFLSKDDGRTYWDECLPPRLNERMEKEVNSSSVDRNLRYLACGPNNSYYAKLVSGQSFWSISTPDQEFKNVMDLFEVQRVAFGSFASGPSWIVIGQNGKVAWRNLPSRLDTQLSKRTSEMAAPCEVSLGEQGSYFIRYLDGEIDFCLPNHIAASCQKILNQGADITNIALHPESSDAFIIRHSQLS